jgi:hypothetical protein
VEVAQQSDLRILVAELAEQAALRIHEEAITGTAHHGEGVAGAEIPSVGVVGSFGGSPIPVVAVAGLEIHQRSGREGETVRIAWRGAEGESGERRASEQRRVVEREIRHPWHPVVLDLPVAERS